MIEYQFESLGPVIHILILILMILLAIAAVSLIVVMAASPGRIAKARSHPQTEAINVLGWVGLPAGIVLWVVALVWAFYRQAGGGDATVRSTDYLLKLTQQIERLEQVIASIESRQKEVGK